MNEYQDDLYDHLLSSLRNTNVKGAETLKLSKEDFVGPFPGHIKPTRDGSYWSHPKQANLSVKEIFDFGETQKTVFIKRQWFFPNFTSCYYQERQWIGLTKEATARVAMEADTKKLIKTTGGNQLINISNEKMTKLYHLINDLMVKLSENGVTPSELDAAAVRVMKSLFDIDGGVYNANGHLALEPHKKLHKAPMRYLTRSRNTTLTTA